MGSSCPKIRTSRFVPWIAAAGLSIGGRPVSFEEWERVDAKEKANGKDLGKPREKITSLKEILQVAFAEVARERNGNKAV
ncbi:hypothetical protein ACTXT7_006738 [Hymenolepis weldensis]